MGKIRAKDTNHKVNDAEHDGDGKVGTTSSLTKPGAFESDVMLWLRCSLLMLPAS